MSGIFSITGNSAPTGFYDHTINQSLRFEDGDNAYLNITPSSTGNQKTFTYSCWVKLGNLGTSRTLLAQHTSGSNTFVFRFDASNNLQVENYVSSYQLHLVTDAEFRDVGAWYNVVLRIDTTQSTDTDRARLYVNGTEQTSFSSSTYPSQNTDLKINSTNAHHIGARTSGSFNFDGYLTDINFIDGQSLAPTSFGETKAGIWIPKDTSGLTFGTNGFRLKFQDSSALGDDTSGNGNDFSSNGLAATDVVLDSPTNNFATLNTLDKYLTNVTLSEGNLEIDTSASNVGVKSTYFVNSGKWYYEARVGNSSGTPTYGAATSSWDNTYVGNTGSYGYLTNGYIYVNASAVQSSLATATTGDIIGIALNMDDNEITFYKNNTQIGTTVTGLESELAPAFAGQASSQSQINFGQDSSFAGNETAQGNTDGNGKGDFYYSPPSGFLALCSANLPDPAIDPAQDEEPADYFNTVLYTGNGTSVTDTQAISGVGFSPDFTWIKNRTSGGFHILNDRVRGAGNNLFINSTAIENTGGASTGDLFPSFDSDGFTVKYGYAGGANSGTNQNTDAYVAWNWLAGGTAVTNDVGDIQSQVSVNSNAGFSIVTWTGNGSASDTVGHGLGAKPDLAIYKRRTVSVSDWYAIFDVLDGSFDRLKPNDTSVLANASGYGTMLDTNTISNFSWPSGASMLAYCFRSIDGYSKIGTYSGTGSATGAPFVYTGFRPAWVMLKNTDGTYDWVIFDAKRSTFNLIDDFFVTNGSATEYTASTTVSLDFTSNGFKIREDWAGMNNSGDKIFYIAFAEQPFKYSNAR
tara:strand:- start:2298 stop:4706 length:2409 start_codon:yes stop_codon:yes gene_type:complete